MYKNKCFFGFLAVLSLSLFFTACTKPDINFGAAYLDNSFTNIVTVDTATAAISTVLVDSFVSSGTGKAVIGNYTDPYFGAVSAQSYFPVVPPAFSDIYRKGIYDSLELIIKPDSSFYGDTTLPLKINVNQLSEQIAYAENSSSLYNVNSFAVDPTLLGSKTVVIKPSVTDTISIRLSDAKGMELLNKFKNADADVTTNDKFIQYFKGLRISTGSTGYMLGLRDSVIMRLHYRDPGIITQNKTIDFTLSDASLQFNHISVNRNGTALSALNSSNREIPSTATNNGAFMQYATGTAIKVQFPYLRNFLQIPQFVKIIRAELVVKPQKNSFSPVYPLPPAIRLSQTSLSNDFGADVTATVSGTSVTQYGNLTIDYLYGQNTAYTFDVTDYITAQIAIKTNNSNGLLLSPPANANVTRLNRLVVGDKQSEIPGVQLKLYYLTVAK